MERTTVTFSDSVYEKLKNRSEKNGDIPIAQSIRELVDIGFRLEEATENQKLDEEGDDLLGLIADIKILLKNNLNWSLETRLLQRYLIENHQNIDKSEASDVLIKYKDIAINHVDILIDERKK